ncbi:MAG: sigma-70 family RNA polymerase sigma factor [Deltaproteobacteria bacterium]|nr:sigma-70 family RNA polymerase sigma factor [Deltaproteobacteria bacterium]
MEDKLLVYRCKRGNEAALTRIYEKYKKNLFLLAMTLLNDRTASEDVVHDVFVTFVRRLDDFRLTGSLKSYLMTCVANNARNRNRAERLRSNPLPDSEMEFAGCAEGPLETVICNEQMERLSNALAELSFEQREVVMMHLHASMTFREIASARQISTNTAKSRYRYGIEKLRSILNDGGDR